MVFFDNLMNLADLRPVESAASLKPDRIKPELGNIIITLDVDVLRLIAITGVKKGLGSVPKHLG